MNRCWSFGNSDLFKLNLAFVAGALAGSASWRCLFIAKTWTLLASWVFMASICSNHRTRVPFDQFVLVTTMVCSISIQNETCTFALLHTPCNTQHALWGFASFCLERVCLLSNIARSWNCCKSNLNLYKICQTLGSNIVLRLSYDMLSHLLWFWSPWCSRCQNEPYLSTWLHY